MSGPRYMYEVIRWVEGRLLADVFIELANARAADGWRLHSWSPENAQAQGGVFIMAVFESDEYR
jgi:hypothetical protein